MSKRKEPEGAALAAAPAAPPPRLGDHSSYMPEPMLPLADVRIKVEGGAVLPAHSTTLVRHCDALARSSELFVDASPARPAALSSPFDEYAEADVARFLRCIYTAAAAPAAADLAQPAVVRLAHALDAAPLLAAARRHLLGRPFAAMELSNFNEVDQIAALCGWDDVCVRNTARLALDLQSPLGAATTPTQLALSSVLASSKARRLVADCSPDFVARVVGTLIADYGQLHAAASVEARNSTTGPGAMAARAAGITHRPGTAIEVEGRFVFLGHVPAFSDTRVARRVEFKCHNLAWHLVLQPNGVPGGIGNPVVGLRLVRGSPKFLRYQAGFANLRDASLRESPIHVVLIACGQLGHSQFADLPPAEFRDPAAGWIARGVAAPFVRILEVRDPTPAELAAAEAANV